ncbi:hypothetical protein EV127DRAFT_351051 [Xylaria flabelliformis]|nr:hypothetical protein EV127DRAFT_351051 [Xylaria flabelliformis]
MYRAAVRSAPRITTPLRRSCVAASGRRFASTAPADKKRTWKGSAVRWGLAVGAVYFYSTSAAFAEEPKRMRHPSSLQYSSFSTIQPPPSFSDEDLPTVEAVVARKRQEAEARSQKAAAAESKIVPEPETAALAAQTSPEAPAKEVEADDQVPSGAGGPEELEEEAAQQGAFNPETGEINWDCPCLGGMAHGPCGEEFKAAFSCFVYSTEEPKGMDCIDKFQHMQDCFRLHPEVYSDELAEDDEAEAAVDGAPSEGLSARDASAESATTTESSAPEPTKNVTPIKDADATEVSRKTGEEKPERERDATTGSSPTTKTTNPKSLATK